MHELFSRFARRQWRQSERLTKVVTALATQKMRILIFAVGFAIVGSLIMLISRAASNTIDFEAEGGRLSGNSEEFTDTTASDGKGVVFNDPDAPEPVYNKDVLRFFAPAFGVGVGDNGPDTIGQRYEAFFGFDDPRPMKNALGSNIKVYRYVLGEYAKQDQLPGGSNALHDDAFAKNLSDQPITMSTTESGGLTLRLIDPDESHWLNYVESNTNTQMALFGGTYDGLFTDNVGTEPVTPGTTYVTDNPVYPPTVGGSSPRIYSRTEWNNGTKVMLARAIDALGDKPLVFQGLQFESTYWRTESESPRALFGTLQNGKQTAGGMAERIYRTSGNAANAWPSLIRWRNEIRMIKDVEQRGKAGYFWTKCWPGMAANASCSNWQQWLRFTLSSHLLAAGSKSFYAFDHIKDSNNAEWYATEYSQAVALGNATEEPVDQNVPYLSGSGYTIYRRRFANGLVLVHAGCTTTPCIDSAPINLGQNMRSLDGGLISSLTLPPNSGAILLEP